MKTTKSLFGILTGAAALVFQVHAQSFITDGLVAYYPFNGNANDASGNGNNGILYGATLTTNLFGANAAYSFNGNGQFILTPDSPSLDTGNQLTLAVWVNFNSGGNYNPRIISKNGNHGYELTTLGTSSQRQIAFYANGSSGINTIQSINAGEWAYLTATYDGSQMSIYVNGMLDSSAAASCLFSNATDLAIGRNSQNGLDSYSGIIGNVRIYNRALSQNEVAQLYAIESAAVSPRLNLTIALNISKQSASNVTDTISTTAGPTLSKLATQDILNVLAFDEHIAGNWPSNSFPKNTTLALAGNSIIVLNGTNVLLNVSAIMSFNAGETKVVSGKQNTVTGLANFTTHELQIAGIMFDDTFIEGGKHLKFYLNGVLSKTTADTTPINGVYTETQTLKITSAAGDGTTQDVPFICTGSVSATGKSPLNL